MFIVWYAMYGISGYGMKFYSRDEAIVFMEWMASFPKIYSDYRLEER